MMANFSQSERGLLSTGVSLSSSLLTIFLMQISAISAQAQSNTFTQIGQWTCTNNGCPRTKFKIPFGSKPDVVLGLLTSDINDFPDRRFCPNYIAPLLEAQGINESGFQGVYEYRCT